MSLTPQITLTVNLYDYQGNIIGASSAPAYLRIALCGYGQTLPCIAGTGMVAALGGDIPFVGSVLNVKLWGNDVITPSNTYYAISILDANKNVVQSGIYQFTGTQTIDLSQATQIVQPSPANAATKGFLHGAGALATFPLPFTPQSNSIVLVFWAASGGTTMTLLEPGVAYTIGGSTITFTPQLASGSQVFVYYWI